MLLAKLKFLSCQNLLGSGRMQFLNRHKTKSGTLKPQDAYGLPISWRNFTVLLESLHGFSHQMEGIAGAQPARLVCCLSQRVPPQTYKWAALLHVLNNLLDNMADSTSSEFSNNPSSAQAEFKRRSNIACNGCRKLKMKVRTFRVLY